MSNDIKNMDVKQLRNEVQLLCDELSIMQRKYEDILYNLDTDNFSSRFVKEQGDMKTAIEVTAEGIKTMVSKDEFQSEMKQVADEISLSVSALGDEISSLSVSTSGIRSKVNNIEDGEFNGYTLFEQTGSKFSFTGNVEISGDAVAGGTISGSALKNSRGTTKLELGTSSGNFGDLTLYRIYNDYDTEIFQVYDNATSIDLNALGQCFLYSSGDTTYPIGYWDFSQCSHNLGSGGTGSGGTVVAVFG